MNREDTIKAIVALPVSDQVKAHARKLIEGLPEWCPMPDEVCPRGQSAQMRWLNGIDEIYVVSSGREGDDWYAHGSIGDTFLVGNAVTIKAIQKMLRQLTGMVALTGGG